MAYKFLIFAAALSIAKAGNIGVPAAISTYSAAPVISPYSAPILARTVSPIASTYASQRSVVPVYYLAPAASRSIVPTYSSYAPTIARTQVAYPTSAVLAPVAAPYAAPQSFVYSAPTQLAYSAPTVAAYGTAPVAYSASAVSPIAYNTPLAPC